jgi:hypothetical protein
MRWLLGIGLLFTLGATDAQFVDGDDWFFLPYPENMYSIHGQAKLGKMKDERPETPGTKVFTVDAENAKFSARTYFQTRLAKPAELTLGRRVVYPMREIGSAKDRPTTWGYRRIVNVVDAPKGSVIVDGSSNPIVAMSTLRVLVGGDADPAIAMTGKEDAHGFHPEHWLVYTDERAPDADGCEAKMGLAIRAPPKPGEPGTFLMLDSGAIVTSKWAWRSHVATRGELKTGTRIAQFTSGPDAPARDLAYRDAWWVGALTRVDGSVIRIGNSSVPINVLRVVE